MTGELPNMGDFMFIGGPMDGRIMTISGWPPRVIDVTGGRYVGVKGQRCYRFEPGPCQH
jgi:hypothetical protein